MEAEYEMERHRAASKMQRRQRGILARQRYIEMREERTVEEGRERLRARMRKLRFALRVHASTVRATRQLAEEAAMRRERLEREAPFKVTERRLDVIQMADPEARAAAWGSLKDAVEESDMLLVAYGLKRRIRTKYLDAADSQQLLKSRTQPQRGDASLTARAPSTALPPLTPAAAVTPPRTRVSAPPMTQYTPAPPSAPSRLGSASPRSARVPRSSRQRKDSPSQPMNKEGTARPRVETTYITFSYGSEDDPWSPNMSPTSFRSSSGPVQDRVL